MQCNGWMCKAAMHMHLYSPSAAQIEASLRHATACHYSPRCLAAMLFTGTGAPSILLPEMCRSLMWVFVCVVQGGEGASGHDLDGCLGGGHAPHTYSVQDTHTADTSLFHPNCTVNPSLEPPPSPHTLRAAQPTTWPSRPCCAAAQKRL